MIARNPHVLNALSDIKDNTHMISPSDEVIALVELYIGESFGSIGRAIREEWPFITVREAIELTLFGLEEIYTRNPNSTAGSDARWTASDWLEAVSREKPEWVKKKPLGEKTVSV